MTFALTARLPNGMHWLVYYESIVIPPEDIDRLTDEEIGRYVRMCAPLMHKVRAITTADWILSKWADAKAKPQNVYEEIDQHYDDLSQWRGTDETIDNALRVIVKYSNYHRTREEKKQSKQVKRSQINSRYNNLFVAIGKRDGFQCAHCGAVRDLEIDHIHPLAHDGSNDPSNLQLLCKPCNLRKSDSVSEVHHEE